MSDHSSPDLPTTSAGPSHKRRSSPMTSVLALPPISGALSLVHADLIPSPKRIRSPETTTDLEGCSEDSFEPYIPREVGLRVDVEDESSEQSRSRGTDIKVDDDVERSDEIDIDPVEAIIEACFDFANIIRANGVDVRVEAVTVARDGVEMSARDPIVLVTIEIHLLWYQRLFLSLLRREKQGVRMRHWEIWFRCSMITPRLSQSIVYRSLREFRGSRD
ncbi:hypothetical protein Tco_1162541, partial [Tanacetum coccineum]